MNTTELLNALSDDVAKLKPPADDPWAYLLAVDDFQDLIRTYQTNSGLEQLRAEKPDPVRQYRELRERVLELKRERFPMGCRVKVEHRRYEGPGVIESEVCGLPTDQIAVLLPNGNVWWYPIESVVPEVV